MSDPMYVAGEVHELDLCDEHLGQLRESLGTLLASTQSDRPKRAARGLGKEPAAAPVERRVLPRGVVAHQVAVRAGEPVEALRLRTRKPSESGHVRTA
jgi:hypothetical protein